MQYIYGSIGYTILNNKKNNKRIIIFADMHDTLPECKHELKIHDWFKKKFNTSKILLEEVDDKNSKLEELWPNSPHTQDLKKLFKENSKFINAVDIRPLLIPFSWELIENYNKKEEIDTLNNITLKDYLKNINTFFCTNFIEFKKNIPNYELKSLKNSNLGKHFIKIKKNYGIFLISNKEYINKSIYNIYKNYQNILEQINDILDRIMEWYICAYIDLFQNNSIILHTGLAHSEKVVHNLLYYYDYNIEINLGINRINDIYNNQMKGCIPLPNNLDQYFG